MSRFYVVLCEDLQARVFIYRVLLVTAFALSVLYKRKSKKKDEEPPGGDGGALPEG
jgi:hypothetical protein